MPPADANFLRYVAEAKEVFPTQKRGFNGFATEYRKATPVGKLLLDTFIALPRHHIYLSTQDHDMDGQNMFRGSERNRKISVDHSATERLYTSSEKIGARSHISVDSSFYDPEQKYGSTNEEMHLRSLQLSYNLLIHEATHWLDSVITSTDTGKHSGSPLFTMLQRSAEKISPSFQKNLSKVRSFRGYVVGTNEQTLKQENFCILSECCIGQKNPPKWVPGMIKDYYETVVKLHLELMATDPALYASLRTELAKPLPQLMGEAFPQEIDALTQKITALPERSSERQLLERELRDKWNEAFSTIADNVKRSIGEKVHEIPSLRSGQRIG